MTTWPWILTLTCALLQTLAWLAGWRQLGHESAATYLGIAEMALMLGLLWNGWRIQQRMSATSSPQAKLAARWGLASLTLCSLGDLINRNFWQRSYTYDVVIEHSYLADSVWCFLPGYLIWVCLAWRVSTPAVSTKNKLAMLAVAGLTGLGSWYNLHLHGTNAYILGMTSAYSLVITAMVPAGIWLLMAFGWRAKHVAMGAVLAALADALIAQFWLFGNGHYPGIAHLNFVVYMTSQALIQQLPGVITNAPVQTKPMINSPVHQD